MRNNDKYINLGGTIRARNPEETFARAKKLFTKLGITRVANVTGLDTIGIPVYVSIRPNAKHLSVSQGKGISEELAKVSAVMESIETYHVENAKEPSLVGAYKKLNGEYNLINPDEIHNSFVSSINWQEREVGWAKGQELLSDKEIYFPHILTTLDTSFKDQDKSLVLISSNGLASGNCLEEATCHAIYEVIERDSLFRWSKNNQVERDKTRINLESIDSPIIRSLLDKFSKAGVLVKIWDVTSKVGVPSFQVVILDRNLLRPLGRFNGSGAHLNRDIALTRALTEAAQSRLTLISGSRDDVFPSRYQERVTEDHSQIEDMLKKGERDFSDCQNPSYSDSFKENVSELLVMLKSADFTKVILYDHTKEELQVSVVQVFIPGMLYSSKTA